LSGSNVFNVTSRNIRNIAAQPQNTGINHVGSGSVLVVGKEITKIVFKVYIRGQDGLESIDWGEGTEDGWMLGVSLNESDVVTFLDRKIAGSVRDDRNQPLKKADIYIYDLDNRLLDSTQTTNEGIYEISVDRDRTYKVEAKMNGYFSTYRTISTATEQRMVNGNLSLKKMPAFVLEGKITEKQSGALIDGVRITLTNNFTNEKELLITQSDGVFQKSIANGKLSDRISFTLKLERDGYLSKQLIYNKQLDREGIYRLNDELDFRLNKIEVGMDIGSLIDIKPIYFDLNKFDIRPDAATELDKIVAVMNENPNMVIELGSHTDCRGSAAYNLDLSDKRAKASADYIKQHISNPERITGKGYGESKPVNDCDCDAGACPEEQHQENRRTEFTILKIE
jgi:outer membrane protein OmpA-like peptidoglycan-associated protein